MLEHYKAISLTQLEQHPQSISPDRGHKELTLDDPAIAVLTDHRLEKVSMCRPEAHIDQAMVRMGRDNTSMLLVSSDQENIEGLITSADISGERSIQYIQSAGKKRDQVKVKHVMRRIEDLPCIAINDVLDARIGDILHTLNDIGSEYILVTMQEHDHVAIRGVFSSRHIAKALKIFFDPSPGARTFAEFTKALHSNAMTH